jgi:hypothetical protein
MYHKPRPFTPMLMKCSKCEDPLQSSRPGEYVGCSCGASAVDQTGYYDRYLGVPVVDRDAMQEAWECALESEVPHVEDDHTLLVWAAEMAEEWGEDDE